MVLESAPHAALVDRRRHGGGVVIGPGGKESRLAPDATPVDGPADYDPAVFAAGSHQVERRAGSKLVKKNRATRRRNHRGGQRWGGSRCSAGRPAFRGR